MIGGCGVLSSSLLSRKNQLSMFPHGLLFRNAPRLASARSGKAISSVSRVKDARSVRKRGRAAAIDLPVINRPYVGRVFRLRSHDNTRATARLAVARSAKAVRP